MEEQTSSRAGSVQFVERDFRLQQGSFSLVVDYVVGPFPAVYRLEARRPTVSVAASGRGSNSVESTSSHPPTLGVIDAKSLYDALLSEQTQQDDARAFLEIGVIRDDAALLGLSTRWIPHNLNPADALTKADKAHTDPLIKMLATATFQISPEEDEMERRSQEKEVLGYAPRLRSNAEKRAVEQRPAHCSRASTVRRGYKV